MLIVAMDANFRLRSKLRGAGNKNFTLGAGWSYFVDNGPYSDFIKDYVDDEEVSVQSIYTTEEPPNSDPVDFELRWIPSTPQYAHQEVEGPTRYGDGRGELRSSPDVSPSGNGRFTKGRTVRWFWLLYDATYKSNIYSQCNMDYLFASSIVGVGIRMLTVSYDVGCHWFIKFWTRMDHLPAALTSYAISPILIRVCVWRFPKR
jgi:hypothetical protein